MTELGPALIACLLAASLAAAVLRRPGLSTRCLALAAAMGFALTEPAGLGDVLVVVAAGAPLLAVLQPERGRAWSIWLVASAVAAAVVLVAVATDPFRDPTCLVRCSTNPLALGRIPFAPIVANALIGFAAVMTAAQAIRRRSVLGGAGAALAVTVILDVASVTGALVTAACIGLVRGTAEVLAVVQARGRLADVAMALEQSHDPTASMREQLYDPDVSVAFALPDGSVVDEDGAPAPEVRHGQQVDLITVGESTIARVCHRPTTSRVAVARAMTGAARLALDNARLLAVSRLNARLLQESRARVVKGGDEERRLLERDLHDGAQQEVLSLGLALREELSSTTDLPRRQALEDAAGRIPLVLESLRELGHGLRPAGLDGAGLSIALEAIADRARVPVDVVSLPEEDLQPGAVVAIAGLVARQADTADAPLRVEVVVVDGRVVTTITGGVEPTPVEIDRFVTIGGGLGCDGVSTRAWLPTGER
ncbi:histidine kinase [Humibacillus xanthopallidus]|uniref:Histidine kinase n=2 Tax=Humibacillus xanthopallidus TaxID=412689 RepID=A0A543PQW3_9MICO|nr:histidine kinase [Humibacillus xanthopallidus]TQN46458.1 histidine kinase [Humibacillus xanthopallidus]